MIFKDYDEESRLEPVTIGLIIYAGVQAIVTSGIAITKKKRQNEEAARQARQRYYEALIKLNDQRKSEYRLWIKMGFGEGGVKCGGGPMPTLGRIVVKLW